MRTITLELVRHGPAHNQLLSPLTQYLALCENHPAVTLQLPVEHNQMLYRLRALAYRMGSEPREFQLRDTASLLGDLLAMIPGLTADMNRQQTANLPGQDADAPDDGAVHLRLVLSASELALLPFELALAPVGFPGSGQPLLLQSLRPLALTRETRRVPEARLNWPEDTRVLFAVASPPGLVPPPAEAHLLALRRAIEPWVGILRQPSGATVTAPDSARLGDHLTVITNASIEDIETACAEKDFTHVHLLAHGDQYPEGYDTRFGLMLHKPGRPDQSDMVSGERLATALRASRRDRQGQLARPAVVTLASCNSSAVSSVAGVGASIAHALHADGIPMVIASQFPLSFAGSVRMVEILYEGLLSGEDPRRLLIDLRRSLHAQFPDTHDWASITAYSSLPPNFERQLAAGQIQRASSSIDVALDLADTVVSRVRSDLRSMQVSSAPSSSSPTTRLPATDTEMEASMDRVNALQKRLSALIERLPDQSARIVALLASSEKRVANIQYEMLIRRTTPGDPTFLQQVYEKVWVPLDHARQLYDRAFTNSPNFYWAVVQHLSLQAVMRQGGVVAEGDTPMHRDIAKMWALAEVQSQRDLAKEDLATRAWAAGNLIELYLLGAVLDEVVEMHKARRRRVDWPQEALRYTQELLRISPQDSFFVFSTRRQIVRYMDFYADLVQRFAGAAGLAPAVAIAEQVAARLPAFDTDDTLA